jgi:hypothetical protein
LLRVTWSQAFKDDIRTLSEKAFQYAIENDEAPLEAEQSFQDKLKKELKKTASLIQVQPFACQAYSKQNPTRRGIISNGDLILEYQLNPFDSQKSEDVLEVIFTALVAARSERYSGAYNDIELVDFDDLASDQ